MFMFIYFIGVFSASLQKLLLCSHLLTVKIDKSTASLYDRLGHTVQIVLLSPTASQP